MQPRLDFILGNSVSAVLSDIYAASRTVINMRIAARVPVVLLFVGAANADEAMTDVAKIAQLIPNKLNRNYQLPFTYNYNRDLGLASNMN